MTGKRRISLLLFALALWGCDAAAPDAASTPQDALATVQSAVANKEWTAVYELTPPSERASYESHWQQAAAEQEADRKAIASVLGKDECQTMAYSDVFPLLMAWFSERNPEVLRSFEEATCNDLQIEGIRCRMHSSQGDAGKKLILLREEGRWFVSGLLSCVHRHALAAARDDAQR